MTFKTWKQEFYPISARIAADRAKTVDGFDDVALAQHSLRKWQGLRPENLKRHGVEVVKYNHGAKYITSGNSLVELNIDSGTCALCDAHIKGYDEADDPCETCPLYQSRGKVACDDYNEDEDEDEENIESPWHQFAINNDPEPMIKALEDTLAFLELRDSSSK